MRALLLVVVAGCAATRPPAPAPIADLPPTPALVEPMARLASLRGVWTGPASHTDRDGTHQITQTERVGPMLGGDILVVEGRGYAADSTTAFNAFAVISYNTATSTYELRSYNQGRSGTFELRLTDTGYVWEIPAGPDALVRFTATVTADTWHEVGEYLRADAPPVTTVEMNLRRVADTDWPRGTPIRPSTP
jgi:hypothetical protein